MMNIKKLVFCHSTIFKKKKQAEMCDSLLPIKFSKNLCVILFQNFTVSAFSSWLLIMIHTFLVLIVLHDFPGVLNKV